MDHNLDLGGIAHVLDDDKINNGTWIHLDGIETDPEAGNPLLMYLDPETKLLPVRALVRSYRARVVKEAEAKLQRLGYAKMNVGRKKNRGEVMADHTVLSDEKRFTLLLVALENVSKVTPGRQDVDPDSAAAIFNNSAFDWLVAGVREAAYEDTNFKADSQTENPTPKPAPKPAARADSPV